MRSSEPSSYPVKSPPTPLSGKVRSSVHHQGMQYPLPNLAGRYSLLEQTVFTKAERNINNGSSDDRNLRQSGSHENSGQTFVIQTSDLNRSSSRSTSSHPDWRTEMETCPLRKKCFQRIVWNIFQGGWWEYLKHSPKLRESDGAISWKTLMNECKWFDRTTNWTFDDGKICLEKTWFERRKQSNPVHEISSTSLKKRKINPRVQKNVFLLYGWSDCSYHVAASYDHRSIRDGGLTAGGLGFRRERRQSCFFTAVDPMVLTSRDEETNREKFFKHCNGDQRAMQYVGLILRLAQKKNKAWNSGRPSTVQSCCLSRCWQIVW